MNTPIITDEVAQIALNRLSAETVFPRELFQYEIQDDFQSLFIFASIDEFSDAEVRIAVQGMATVLHDLMPVRDDDYSWVVGLKRDGIVVESCSGGNATIPDWDGAHFAEDTSG
jgi:hypothetical protein